jgi:hypothetical protein
VYYRYHWAADILAVIIGALLALNCLRSLFGREDRWDRESATIMLWSNLAGIVIGLGMVAWGLGLRRYLLLH